MNSKVARLSVNLLPLTIAVLVMLCAPVASAQISALNPPASTALPGSGPITAQITAGGSISATCSDVDTCTSGAITTLEAGDALVVVVTEHTTSADAPSSVEEVYTGGETALTLEGDSACSSGHGFVGVYGLADATARSSITITTDYKGDEYYTIHAFDVHGVATSPFETAGTAVCSSAASGTASASVTTTVADDLVILGVEVRAAETISATGGDAVVTQADVTGTDADSGALLDETDASTGSITLSATFTSASWAAEAVALKPSGSSSTLEAGTVSPATASIDATQDVALTSTPATGGTGPYTLQWLTGSTTCSSGTPISNTNSLTYTTPALTAGTYHYCVEVTDSTTPTPLTAYSNVATITVDTTLTVTITPAAPDIDHGTDVSLTATATHGVGRDTYVWTSGSSCTGTSIGTRNRYTTPDLTTTTTYCVSVTDASHTPYTAQALVTVTVSGSALAATISPSAPSIDHGQTVKLTANPTGGTPSYTYRWYSGTTCRGTTLTTAQSYTTPALTATTSYCVAVTDSSYHAATVDVTDKVTVSSAVLSVSIAPPSATILAGQNATFTATPSGGTGTDSYAWYLTTCSGSVLATTATFTTPNLTESATYCVKVTDSAYQPVSVTAFATVTVSNAALEVSINPSAPSIDYGQNVTLMTVVQGGTAPYSYVWYADLTCSGAPSIVGTGANYTTASLTASQDYCVAVTDSEATPVTVMNASSVTVSAAPLTASVSPSSETISSGDIVTLTAEPSGGTGSYSYAWYLYLSSCSGSVLSTSASYTSGPLTDNSVFCVAVNDSAYNPVTVDAFSYITISGPLTASVTPAVASIDYGQNVTLTAVVSGGLGADSFAWYNVSSCSGTILSTNQSYVTSNLTVSTTYCVAVTDTSPTTVTALSVLTVSSGVLNVSISPSNSTVDVGQTVLLTAVVSGGTGPDAYAWYSGLICQGSVLGTGTTYDTPSLGSNQSFCLSVTDSSYEPVTESNTTNITVTNSTLSVMITPNATDIDIGQNVSLLAVASGGTGPYTYQWFLGTDCSGSILATTVNYTTPNLVADAVYCVEAMDSSFTPEVAYNVSWVNVSASPLSVSIAPVSPSIDFGQNLTLTATASGGTGTDSYAWFDSDTCTGSVLATTATYTALDLTATTTFCVDVTDQSYEPVTTNATDTVTVSAAPLTASVVPVNPSIDYDQKVLLTASASGGTGTDSFSWFAGSICSGTVLSSVAAYTTPVLTATATYCVSVTDMAYQPVTVNATSTVTVSTAVLAATVTPAAPSIDNGQTVTLTTNPTGGTGSDSYAWYAGLTCSGSVLAITQAYTTPALTASASYCVAVTDNAYQPVTVDATASVTVSAAPLSVSVTPNDPSIDSGQAVTLTASALGGTGTDSFSWYAGASCSGTPLATTLALDTGALTSTTVYCVAAMDTAYQPVTVTDVQTVTVNAVLSVVVHPAAPSIDTGQKITLTAVASGGTGADSYAWYAGSLCSGTTLVTTAAYTTPTLTSTTAYCVAVTDNAHQPVTVKATDVVTVSAAALSVSVSPTTPSIDFGQTVTLVAVAAGGTGTVSLDWFASATCSGTDLSHAASYTTAALTTSSVFCVTATDSANTPVTVSALSHVNVSAAPLGVTISPASATIDSGQNLTLSAQATGGQDAYHYAWYADANCAGTAISTNASYTTPALVTTSSYCASVTDNAYVAVSVMANVTVTVVAGPSILSFTANPSLVDVGGRSTLTVSATGGVGALTFNYTGLPGGCVSTHIDTLTCTLTTAGKYTVGVFANDTVGGWAFDTTQLDVSASVPTISAFGATPNPVYVGKSTTLQVTESGGTGTVTFAYAGLPTGCTSADNATLVCVPTAAGTSKIFVWANDSAQGTATANLTLTVDPALQPSSISSFVVSPTSIALGATTTFTVQATTGSGVMLVTYTGLPQGCQTTNATTLSCTPTATGSFSVRVYVNNTAGFSANATTSLTVTSAPQKVSSSGGLNAADYAAIALAVLILVALLLYLAFGRKKKQTSEEDSKSEEESKSEEDHGPDKDSKTEEKQDAEYSEDESPTSSTGGEKGPDGAEGGDSAAES